ncbi:MAG: universal stress protein [Anaerolineales bacterium]|nr:universal stress protein [Anaerolineales bacterium]
MTIGVKHDDQQDKALLSKLLSEQDSPASSIFSIASDTSDDILDVISEAQADLLIMEGYRNPNIIEWIIGSPVDRILQQAAIPVLIV